MFAGCVKGQHWVYGESLRAEESAPLCEPDLPHIPAHNVCYPNTSHLKESEASRCKYPPFPARTAGFGVPLPGGIEPLQLKSRAVSRELRG
jgi:hypothetical protein